MKAVWIRYRNHRGEVAWRHVFPLTFEYAAAPPWHVDAQWIMHVLDLDRIEDGRPAQRTFALKDVLEWSIEPR